MSDRSLTSSVIDLILPISSCLILNICVVPGRNLNGLDLDFLASGFDF